MLISSETFFLLFVLRLCGLLVSLFVFVFRAPVDVMNFTRFHNFLKRVKSARSENVCLNCLLDRALTCPEDCSFIRRDSGGSAVGNLWEFRTGITPIFETQSIIDSRPLFRQAAN